MPLVIIRKSLTKNQGKSSSGNMIGVAHSNKHQRFLLDVEAKYNLLEANSCYSDIFEIYSEILGKEVTDITKLTRVEASLILDRIGEKIRNRVK